MYSGIGGWAGIGMAAGLTGITEGLGAVGGYKDLAKYTTLGGSLFVFALPRRQPQQPIGERRVDECVFVLCVASRRSSCRAA